MKINKFTNEFAFLSNFFPSPVVFEGVEYPSTEHAYQAAKSTNPDIRLSIKNLKTPGQAKRRGQKVELRVDWEQVKIQVMEQLVTLKFQDPELKSMLLATQGCDLEEGNTWGDTFWGTCRGVGSNHLGKILMRVRDGL